MWRAKISNRAFDRMGEQYAHLVDPYHFLGRSAFDIPWKKERLYPAANLKQEGEIFILELAVPGFDKDEIEVTVKEGILTIHGEKRDREKMEKASEFILEEFSVDSFERTFKLAPTVSHEKITAKYENGVLRLTFIDVPKEEELEIQSVKVQ